MLLIGNLVDTELFKKVNQAYTVHRQVIQLKATKDTDVEEINQQIKKLTVTEPKK